MARSKNGVNKSQAIRELIKENPKIKASEAVEQLASKSIKISANQFYFVKGHLKATKGRRRRIRRQVGSVTANSNGAATKIDAVTAVTRLKALAEDLGGMGKLVALVEALR
jgi:hypothetical protein